MDSPVLVDSPPGKLEKNITCSKSRRSGINLSRPSLVSPAFTARVVLAKALPRLFPESPGVAATQLLPRPPKPWQVGAIGWASTPRTSRANDSMDSIVVAKAIARFPPSQTALVFSCLVSISTCVYI